MQIYLFKSVLGDVAEKQLPAHIDPESFACELVKIRGLMWKVKGRK